jgi:hypothetical protein
LRDVRTEVEDDEDDELDTAEVLLASAAYPDAEASEGAAVVVMAVMLKDLKQQAKCVARGDSGSVSVVEVEG